MKRVSESDLARLGERLRALRDEVGLSQKEVAARLEMTEVGYGHFERGRRLPSTAELPWLAHGLGVSIEELLARLGLVDQKILDEPLPEALEGRFRRIAANWEHLAPHDRETVDQILGVASNLGRPDGPPDAPTVAHDDASESPKGTTEFISIISRLNPVEPGGRVHIPSSIAPAPTRELAYASV